MENVTYSEAQGVKPINWNNELSRFNLFPNWSKLHNNAVAWVTCACGNQCAIIPRNGAGVPYDSKLRSLGIKFAEAINFKQKHKAREILKQIERRSQQIINELKHK